MSDSIRGALGALFAALVIGSPAVLSILVWYFIALNHGIVLDALSMVIIGVACHICGLCWIQAITGRLSFASMLLCGLESGVAVAASFTFLTLALPAYVLALILVVNMFVGGLMAVPFSLKKDSMYC